MLTKYNILDNLLSSEDLFEIKSSIEKNKGVAFTEHMGRLYTPFQVSNNIKEKLERVASEKYGKKLNLSEYVHATFASDYGQPRLVPHTDSNLTEFIIDYQVESNIEWSIYLEGNRLILKDNQAIAFSGINNIHWRPKRIFKEGEYLSMIYFHFAGDDLTQKQDEKDPEFGQKQYKIMEDYYDQYLNSY